MTDQSVPCGDFDPDLDGGAGKTEQRFVKTHPAKQGLLFVLTLGSLGQLVLQGSDAFGMAAAAGQEPGATRRGRGATILDPNQPTNRSKRRSHTH